MRNKINGSMMGFLVAALLVVLAALGVAYGLWFKTLTISGSIETGKVHALWTSASSSDRAGAGDQNLINYPPGKVVPAPENKDVGRLDCTIDAVDPEILHFTVVNGYPSYYADCEGEWTNDGTIPVKVVALRVAPEGGTMVDVPFDSWVDLDLNGDGKFDINFQIANGLCEQVDPEGIAANSIKVHVKQDAPQNTPLKFDVEIQLNQWNESSPPCS